MTEGSVSLSFSDEIDNVHYDALCQLEKKGGEAFLKKLFL
jgi:hypothetical protein